jgi:hypothetical protein
MRYLKKTPLHRAISAWLRQRNHRVCQLLDKNPQMLRHEALAIANKQMPKKPGKPQRW